MGIRAHRTAADANRSASPRRCCWSSAHRTGPVVRRRNGRSHADGGGTRAAKWKAFFGSLPPRRAGIRRPWPAPTRLPEAGFPVLGLAPRFAGDVHSRRPVHHADESPEFGGRTAGGAARTRCLCANRTPALLGCCIMRSPRCAGLYLPGVLGVLVPTGCAGRAACLYGAGVLMFPSAVRLLGDRIGGAASVSAPRWTCSPPSRSSVPSCRSGSAAPTSCPTPRNNFAFHVIAIPLVLVAWSRPPRGTAHSGFHPDQAARRRPAPGFGTRSKFGSFFPWASAGALVFVAGNGRFPEVHAAFPRHAERAHAAPACYGSPGASDAPLAAHLGRCWSAGGHPASPSPAS